MVSALNSRASGLGLSPGQGHCVVFLGKTLLFTLAVPLFTQVYKWLPANLGVEILLVASCYRNRDKLRPDGPLG